MGTILRAIISYFFLLLTVRVLSRRPGAQMTLFEFVIVFLIGGIDILATTGGDRSMTNCVGAILTVGLMHRLVSALKQKFPRFGAIVDGTPLVLLKNDEWQMEIMHKMRLADDDVMASARTKGFKTLQDIRYAILERNGGISVYEKKKK